MEKMRSIRNCLIATVLLLQIWSCSKAKQLSPTPVTPSSFSFAGLKVNGVSINSSAYKNVNTQPVIRISFSAAINHNSTAQSITFDTKTGTAVSYTTAYDNHDSTIVI